MPEITKVDLDNSITLQMQSTPPGNPTPRGSGKKGEEDPFKSPFGDKPFS